MVGGAPEDKKDNIRKKLGDVFSNNSESLSRETLELLNDRPVG